ncbi:hypothetical protein PTT_09504 [Pyrenophora teres f. teres 0-1]|uniref:Uncharacterized protein n=1 Tax=Pyrenophora teres f. teres (strain 0-1) TaxID=861557 RepID=E3RM64_PYRTT|nr:hypothetical protein PTT_09504 [Pyrenophora teres f. teres 0-1]
MREYDVDARNTYNKDEKGFAIRPEEYHGGAVFWSPRKIREAQEREVAKQHEAEQL